MDLSLFTRHDETRWEIAAHGRMRVPAVIYASEELIRAMDHKVYEQLTHVATLPGIVQAAYAMPDAHWGYGFPIGGVAAFDAEQGGSALAALIDDRAPRGDQVETTAFGTLSASRLGLPLFTLALGLIDGFNPCATWVLLFLLSLLVRFRDRRRMALVAGTFVLASGAVYFAFMAAWLNLFLIAGMSTPLRWGLALVALAIGAFNVKDFFAWGHGPSLSIPDAALRGGIREMVTGSFWQRLHQGDPSVDLELGELDPRQVALRALAGAA